MTSYWCPWCRADHDATPSVDYGRAFLEGHCTAQHMQPDGSWRVCHAPHDLFGVQAIADAHLCQPCFDLLHGRLDAARRQILLDARGPR